MLIDRNTLKEVRQDCYRQDGWATHAASFPIAMFCNFCSSTLRSLSGNLTLLEPSLISLKISPIEMIECDMAPEILEWCSFSFVSAPFDGVAMAFGEVM